MSQLVRLPHTATTRREDLEEVLSSPDCAVLMKFSRSISRTTIGSRSIPHFADGVKLTDHWRNVAEQFVGRIEKAVYFASSAAERGGKFKVLSKMLMVAPTTDRSDESTVAKVSVYLDDALDDLPAWAVAKAVQRWHRAECGSVHNYTFAPAPGVLRGIALQELEPAKLVLRQLKLVLSAAPSLAEAEKIASASARSLIARPGGE
jgi:hypothetical protein